MSVHSIAYVFQISFDFSLDLEINITNVSDLHLNCLNDFHTANYLL
jgi:hypothetical protein